MARWRVRESITLYCGSIFLDRAAIERAWRWGRRSFAAFPAWASNCAGYCNSLVTSCWMLLAWARAEMPVCDRISYFDRAVVAAA
jgi:hypothetical protein